MQKKVGGVTQKVSSVYWECYELASMAYFSIIILSNARPNLALDLFTLTKRFAFTTVLPNFSCPNRPNCSANFLHIKWYCCNN